MLAASLVYNISPSLEIVAGSKALPRVKGSPHPLQQKATSLLSLSKELLSSYDKLSQELMGYGEALQVGQNWEGDYQKLEHLLHVGKRVTENRLRAMLVEGQQGSRDDKERDEALRQDRKEWEELSGVSMRDDPRETWALAARNLEKGVRRLAKCLPEE